METGAAQGGWSKNELLAAVLAEAEARASLASGLRAGAREAAAKGQG